MADKGKVGKEYPLITWEVERGKIREFAKAIGDLNPIYHDKEAAVKEGYKDCPTPLTFLTVPMMWSDKMPSVINDLKINFMMVLHGEEEYEYYRQIYPGDIITGTLRVADIEEKETKSGSRAKAKTLMVERK
ncbi:MAG: MaoC family dehydratase N-terminal domain-containing protein [Deltaproteobacteria bacterium]|nr:MaoC family dehydratase N-terminal domain-containing protein [Deltaproteobacteria bacterium]